MNGKDVIERSLAMRIARVSVLHPAGMMALALWTSATVAVVILARGSLPFDRPAVASMPFAMQVAAPTVGFLEIFALMGIVENHCTRKGTGGSNFSPSATTRKRSIANVIRARKNGASDKSLAPPT